MSLRIAEIFGPTIQGEGALIGEPTVFVRAGGCDYRCSWCDSLHAVDSIHRHSWAKMDSQAVFERIQELTSSNPITVSISGGNPAIQDFAPLITLGRQHGYRFACETQGSIAQGWFAALDTLVLSPKPPSSGETPDWAAFGECIAAALGSVEHALSDHGPDNKGPVRNSNTKIVLKIVIFDEEDYAWAKDVAMRFPELPLYLQPGNLDVDPNSPVDLQQTTDRLLWLITKVTDDHWFTPRVLPQLHVMVWGNKRGV